MIDIALVVGANFFSDMALTDRQEAFAQAVARGGLTGGQAIRAAGSESQNAASLRVMASQFNAIPEVRERIRDIREGLIVGDLAGVALAALRGILLDEDAPAAARVSAAKWALEAGGHGLEARRLAAREAAGPRGLSDLSLGELEDLARQAADRLQAAVSIPAEAVEVSVCPAPAPAEATPAS